MSEVTRYMPAGEMTDSMIPGKIPSCVASSPDEGWCCTRARGHEGDHEAGTNPTTKIASWPQEQQP